MCLVVLQHHRGRPRHIIHKVHFSQVVACKLLTHTTIDTVFDLLLELGCSGGFFFGRSGGCRLCRWFVARTVVNRVYIIAMQGGQLKVDSAKFDYIAHSYHLLLVIRWEVLQHHVDWAFFANNQPHWATQIDIVFFVFFGFPLRISLLVDGLLNVETCWAIEHRNLVEERLVKEWLVVGPEPAILMLH